MRGQIHILFSGPPGQKACHFIEVENDAGASIKVGQWKKRPDGFWELVIPDATEQYEAAHYELERSNNELGACRRVANGLREGLEWICRSLNTSSRNGIRARTDCPAIIKKMIS